MRPIARRADIARTRDLLPYPRTVALALILVLGAIGNVDVADEIAREAEAKELQPEIARQRQGDAPRCPKLNAAGEWLRFEIASKTDGPDWVYECHYHGIAT